MTLLRQVGLGRSMNRAEFDENMNEFPNRFATIAALKAATWLQVGQVVAVEEYHAGVGGGMLFGRIVAGGTGTEDGGSYIDLAASGLQFEQNFPSHITPEMFGARGDGITDDVLSLRAMRNYHELSGIPVNWGDRSYFTLDSSSGVIRRLHEIRGIGSAKIIRGANTFHLKNNGQTNKIYVNAVTGDDIRDGLSENTALKTLQAAIDTLSNYELFGDWEIILGAGTYARGRFPDEIFTESPVVISGPDVGGHPNVPTAIISEGASVGAVGIFGPNNIKLKAKDVKFIGFDGTTSSCGISVARHSKVYTENCHFQDCYFGVSNQTSGYTNIKGGIFDYCGYLAGVLSNGAGVRSLFNVNHSMGTQNAGNRSNGPIFNNCATAAFAQENSTGHIDFCEINDCNTGISARVNSRFNTDGSAFKRCNRAIDASGNSHVYISDNVEFGTGVDANDIDVSSTSGAECTTTRIIESTELSYSTSERTFETSRLDQIINTTGETVFHESVLKAPLWNDSKSSIYQGKKLHYKIFGILSGTNDFKRINVRLGSTGLAQVTFATSETGTFVAEGHCYFTDNSEQLLTIGAKIHLALSTRHSIDKVSEPMTADTSFTLGAQVGNVADSIEVTLIELAFSG